MRIESVRLKNVTNHQDTEFEFPDVPILTFVGDSGSGKTSLIEAIPLAFYGMCPSRDANVFRSASRSCRGECLVEVVITENEQRLKVARTWKQGDNVTGTGHRVFVSESRKGQWVQLSSGRLADAKKVLDQILPPYEIFLTTNFATQTGQSLITASQEERREILGSLLSPLLFTEFDLLYYASKAERQKETERNRKVKQQLSFVQDRFIETSQKETISVAEIEESIRTQEEKLAVSSRKLTEISQEGNDLKASFAQVQFQIEALLKLQRDRETEQKRLEQVLEDIEKYVEETFDPLQLELLKNEKAQKLSLQEELRVVQEQRNEAKDARGRVEAKRIEQFAVLQNLKKVVLILEDVPCDEELQNVCPFVKDAAEAKRAIPDMSRALDAISEKLEDAEATVKERESAVSVLLGKLERFSGLEENERKLLNLKQSIELRRTTHESTLRERGQLVERIEKFRGEEADTQIDPVAKEFPATLDKLRKRWSKANEANSALKGQLQSTRRSLTIAQQNAEENHRVQEQLKGVGREIVISDAEMEIWTTLEDGFSRRGAQALLLKYELGIFERIIQEYLDVVFADTGKNMKLSFVTEKALKTRDETRESLGILCEVNGVQLEAHELSGGEGQGVSIALRAGLLYYNQMKNYDKLEFCFWDEPTSKTDPRISLNVSGVLEKLQEVYPQIIVSTYDSELLRNSEIYGIREIDGVSQIEKL